MYYSHTIYKIMNKRIFNILTNDEIYGIISVQKE